LGECLKLYIGPHIALYSADKTLSLKQKSDLKK